MDFGDASLNALRQSTMVKEDPVPVERVRWTSTRRANREDDDLNADSIMRGGVCLPAPSVLRREPSSSNPPPAPHNGCAGGDCVLGSQSHPWFPSARHM